MPPCEWGSRAIFGAAWQMNTIDRSFSSRFLEGRKTEESDIQQVAYVSVCREDISKELLSRIRKQADRNNRANGITGILIAQNRTFFQLLEGTPAAVKAVIERISSDEAHHSVFTVLDRTVQSRCFPMWPLRQFMPQIGGLVPLIVERIRAESSDTARQENALALIAIIESYLNDKDLFNAHDEPFLGSGDAEKSSVQILPHGGSDSADGLADDAISVTRKLSASIRQQTEAKRRLEAALAGGELALYDWEIGTTNVVANERWLTMLGLNARDHRPSFSLWQQLVHPDDLPVAEAALADYLSGKSSTYDVSVRMTCQGGEQRYVRCRGQICERDADGNPIRLVGTHQDITEETTLKLELEKHLQQSRDIISEKIDYLAKLSHEIRTPLTGIVGQLSLLQDSNEDPRFAKQLDEISFCANHLENVVEGALYLSKAQSGTLPVSRRQTDAVKIIDSVVSALMNHAKDKGLRLMLHVEPSARRPLVGDRQRITQIAYNLINNAIKYSLQGDVVVSLSAEVSLDERSAEFQLSVEDQGVGISEENQKRIFEKFEQLGDRSSGNYTGVGLGLAIVSELTSDLDGKITLQSKVGEGSKFTVALPLSIGNRRRADTSEDAEETQNSQSLKQLRILVAEDNAVNARYLAAVLDSEDIQYELATDGEKALQAALAEPYDLLVLDVNMPKLTGLQVAEQVRSSEGPNRSVPIIALTANVFPDDIERYRAAGMNSHIGKPFTPPALLQGFHKALEQPEKKPEKRILEFPGASVQPQEKERRSS